MFLSRVMNVNVPLKPQTPRPRWYVVTPMYGNPALVAAARWPASTDVCTACPARFSTMSPAQHPLSPSSRNGLWWLLHEIRAVHSHRCCCSTALLDRLRRAVKIALCIECGATPASLCPGDCRGIEYYHDCGRMPLGSVNGGRCISLRDGRASDMVTA